MICRKSRNPPSKSKNHHRVWEYYFCHSFSHLGSALVLGSRIFFVTAFLTYGLSSCNMNCTYAKLRRNMKSRISGKFILCRDGQFRLMCVGVCLWGTCWEVSRQDLELQKWREHGLTFLKLQKLSKSVQGRGRTVQSGDSSKITQSAI